MRGFRDDWERDGPTIFRWTSPSAQIQLPLLVKGDGFRLRLRARRHFIEPAHVRLAVEGRTVASFEVWAETEEAYRVYEFPLPRLEGRHPFTLRIDAPSDNPRPLGIALDWVEIVRGGSGRFGLSEGVARCAGLVVAVAAAAALLAGAGLLLPGAHAALLLLAILFGTAVDPLAAERVLREGVGPYVAVAGLALALILWRRTWSGLAVGVSEALAPRLRSALVVIVLLALALRLTMLLHPRFYYPDVRVHSLFVRELARQGVVPFLAHFTDNQFRYSLGLQYENGHWYAFPYPPAFYMLCAPLVSVFRFSPELAVSIVPAALNSLEALIAFAIAQRLRLSTLAGLGCAATLALLPLFLVRLSLAYFPALAGHAVDALVILVLLASAARMDRPRNVLGLAGLVALALLTYTQSVINLALLIPLFLALQGAFDRAPGCWRRHLGLAIAGALGAALACGLFYARYVPVFLDMKRGVAMAGETLVLDRLERLRGVASEPVVEEHDDPYAQPTMDLFRGVRKAAHRLRIFYGPFALVVAVGYLMLIRRSDPVAARFVTAWGATYVLICLGSGGLPGPNLLRYSKELEVIAPLCCVTLATVGSWLWQRARFLGVVYAVLAASYGAQCGVNAFLERLTFRR